jgi:regulator of RNase E activity RraA
MRTIADRGKWLIIQAQTTGGAGEMPAIDLGQIKEFKQIGTSTWSDVLDEMGVQGVIGGLSRRGGDGRFAALAMTAKAQAGPLGSVSREEFAVGQMIDAAGPGEALVIDAGGAGVSTFGGLASLAARIKGIEAVVIDGACRDVEEIRETGLWLASRHVMPLTGKRRIRVESIGQRISIGGVGVGPGDLLVGDDTGIVVIPRQHLGAALEISRRIVGIDHQIERAIRSGVSFRDAARSANYI